MASSGAHQPLAERLRPRNLGEVIGQQQLLGPGMPLRIAFESGQAQGVDALKHNTKLKCFAPNVERVSGGKKRRLPVRLLTAA